MEPQLIVKLNRPVNAKAKGVYGLDNKPLSAEAPAGRRVYMDQTAAVKATLDGHVDMLSPLGLRLVEKAREAKIDAKVAIKAPKVEAEK